MDQPGPVLHAIKTKITQALAPTQLEVVDDSSKHKGHAGTKGLRSTETHFRVVIVSDAFASKSLVQRHKLVYEILDQEINSGVHALSLVTKTPQEFENYVPK
ncbi:hypothetical protein BATDEDRAFT_89896 [Batrachochytrium dendrobatidis JAM81]|uniref:BolA-like protein n=2 Tax=Batrachochytrium dendrobatidis TaxID=109871 RepID=F4P5R4_BATDJ|nr:uncharacterized protein BATDEDRAFT_89896 [Batrachochytrium dendrobatidis JAM81]EGF79232.1 hypothetical protein BATDEDRAFT_89896 [Batrachochytrium dendrobatidis JAM81]OAJ42839.1 hypothetical protein BDEG_26245 [Batrachochytrium dendrobatidis JEL423]|eukprot:XP_006680068.1 hypothetical protein BATDEDRAFT_89896 [Batrachochytrium dendrobatidis JAM81]